MKPKYLLFSIILATTGCLPGLNITDSFSLKGTWRLYDAEKINKNSKTIGGFKNEVELRRFVKNGDVINFFEDGTFSEIREEGKFTICNWKSLSGKNELELIENKSSISTMPFKFEKSQTGKKVLILSNPSQNIALKFIKEAEPMTDFADDPFYPGNNAWRLKPLRAENRAELFKRLGNYIKHLALILKSAKERKQDVVSFEFSLGPVKIYNGGIGIHPYKIVPENWKKSFYNEADASVGYLQYEEYLRTNSYKGASIGDWIEDDYNILTSIYSDIDQLAVQSNP